MREEGACALSSFRSFSARWVRRVLAQRPHTVIGPDGAPWIAVTCSHGAQNCWREAGEVCPGGYVKADQGGSAGAVGIAGRAGGVIVPTQHDQMLIQCKSGAAASR